MSRVPFPGMASVAAIYRSVCVGIGGIVPTSLFQNIRLMYLTLDKCKLYLRATFRIKSSSDYIALVQRPLVNHPDNGLSPTPIILSRSTF